MSNAVEVLLPQAQDERQIDIGLGDSYRADMAESLSTILAATYQLIIKNHIYHWNVVGPLFKPLHELTESNYEALFKAADIIAERIRALGHLAPPNLGQIAAFSPKEDLADQMTAIEMVEDLILDHESSVRIAREAAKKADSEGDLVTADMLTERLTFHEKALWMLRATVSG